MPGRRRRRHTRRDDPYARQKEKDGTRLCHDSAVIFDGVGIDKMTRGGEYFQYSLSLKRQFDRNHFSVEPVSFEGRRDWPRCSAKSCMSRSGGRLDSDLLQSLQMLVYRSFLDLPSFCFSSTLGPEFMPGRKPLQSIFAFVLFAWFAYFLDATLQAQFWLQTTL